MAHVRVPIQHLRAVGDAVLRTLSFPAPDRDTILDVLLYAQLRGNNQNFVKLVSGGVPRHEQLHRATVVDGGATFSIDARGTFGMIAMRDATLRAIAGARAHGVCVGGLHGVASTTGAIGFWAREVARAGLVGVVTSQSPELVAPHGSALALLGTNPVAFGFPRLHASDGHVSTIVVDVATSAAAYYAVVAARGAGGALPRGVAVDAAGRPTIDPTDVSPPDRGALLPFGGELGAHKGSALAVAVELLGVLAGGAGVGKWAAANWGNLVIAIDPARFQGPPGDARSFAARVDEVAARIEAAPPAPAPGAATGRVGISTGTASVEPGGSASGTGAESESYEGMRRVFLPGQRGDEAEAACLREGSVLIATGLWKALQDAAAGAADAAASAAAISSPSPVHPGAHASESAAGESLSPVRPRL